MENKLLFNSKPNHTDLMIGDLIVDEHPLNIHDMMVMVKDMMNTINNSVKHIPIFVMILFTYRELFGIMKMFSTKIKQDPGHNSATKVIKLLNIDTIVSGCLRHIVYLSSIDMEDDNHTLHSLFDHNSFTESIEEGQIQDLNLHQVRQLIDTTVEEINLWLMATTDDSYDILEVAEIVKRPLSTDKFDKMKGGNSHPRYGLYNLRNTLTTIRETVTDVLRIIIDIQIANDPMSLTHNYPDEYLNKLKLSSVDHHLTSYGLEWLMQIMDKLNGNKLIMNIFNTFEEAEHSYWKFNSNQVNGANDLTEAIKSSMGRKLIHKFNLIGFTSRFNEYITVYYLLDLIRTHHGHSTLLGTHFSFIINNGDSNDNKNTSFSIDSARLLIEGNQLSGKRLPLHANVPDQDINIACSQFAAHHITNYIVGSFDDNTRNHRLFANSGTIYDIGPITDVHDGIEYDLSQVLTYMINAYTQKYADLSEVYKIGLYKC